MKQYINGRLVEAKSFIDSPWQGRFFYMNGTFAGAIIHGNSRSDVANGSFKLDMGVPTEYRILNTDPNQLFNEIEPLIGVIEQIRNARNMGDNYRRDIGTVQGQIEETKIKQEAVNQELHSLAERIGEFDKSEILNNYTPDHLSHILIKTYEVSEYQELKDLILRSDFNPNYLSKEGNNLLKIAISNNDVALFKILLDHDLDLNNMFGDVLGLEMILNSSESFGDLISGYNIDYGFSALKFLSEGKTELLAKLLGIKPELASFEFKGYSLLQCALIKNEYKIAKLMLDQNSDLMNDINSYGMTAVKICLISGNNEGLDLLKGYGASEEKELIELIRNDNILELERILSKNKYLLNSTYNGVTLDKFIMENGSFQMFKKLFDNNLIGSNFKSGDNDDLYYAIEGELEIAEYLLSQRNIEELVDSVIKNADTGKILDLIKLQSEVVINILTRKDNNSYTEKLLEHDYVISTYGKELLKQLCLNVNIDLLNKLLEVNPTVVNYFDEDGKTIFHLIVENLESEHQKLLSEVIMKNHQQVDISSEEGHLLMELFAEDSVGLLFIAYQNNMLIGENNPFTSEDIDHIE